MPVEEFSDDWIVESYYEIRQVWGIVEALVDHDVASGEYEGCSTQLELAWAEHERRVVDVLKDAGIEV